MEVFLLGTIENNVFKEIWKSNIYFCTGSQLIDKQKIISNINIFSEQWESLAVKYENKFTF